jgi:hypothetical protein
LPQPGDIALVKRDRVRELALNGIDSLAKGNCLLQGGKYGLSQDYKLNILFNNYYTLICFSFISFYYRPAVLRVAKKRLHLMLHDI